MCDFEVPRWRRSTSECLTSAGVCKNKRRCFGGKTSSRSWWQAEMGGVRTMRTKMRAASTGLAARRVVPMTPTRRGTLTSVLWMRTRLRMQWTWMEVEVHPEQPRRRRRRLERRHAFNRDAFTALPRSLSLSLRAASASRRRI